MGKGLSIAGFVTALVGLVLGFIAGIPALFGLPLAITGLVLSVVGGKKVKAETGNTFGLSVAGLVVGIIATVITAITFFTCGICVLAVADAVNDILG